MSLRTETAHSFALAITRWTHERERERESQGFSCHLSSHQQQRICVSPLFIVTQTSAFILFPSCFDLRSSLAATGVRVRGRKGGREACVTRTCLTWIQEADSRNALAR